MTMKKEYITWTRFMADPRYLTDPSSAFNTLWGHLIKFKETGWGNQPEDLRFLGTIEYDDTEVTEDLLDRMVNNFAYQSFKRIDIDKVKSLLDKWYGEEIYLDKDNFTVIDDRPKLEEME